MRYIIPIIFEILFIVLIVLVKTYDVAAIGPCGTQIGFSTLNNLVHEYTGENMFWYNLTDIFGYVAISVCAFFGVVGFIQMIKRKGIFKVDEEIIALGVLYIITISIYVLFEFVIVNYRPIIMPDETLPEASFPSSHSVLICVVMATAPMLFKKYINSKPIRIVLRIVCYLLLVTTVYGRLMSGAHWFTDIMGGILMSASLISLFSAYLNS